jgi:G3E family GTPase
VTVASIPLTVIGGYLGAGKTTVLNHLLRNAGGRRIGVIVNDFGSLAIDADLLRGSSDGIVSLPNGCVCCTVGAGLHEALRTLTESQDDLDHIVIEVSGVADPVVAAGWGTVPPFEPGGVIVLAAADSIRSHARDKYIGGEVVRQLQGADLVLVTKSDLCDVEELEAVGKWLDEISGGAPRLAVTDGDVSTDVVLGGVRSEILAAKRPKSGHTDRYLTWSWSSSRPVASAALQSFLEALPSGVLRLKGFVALDDGSSVLVQVVGRRSVITPLGERLETDSRLVAIGLAELLDPADLDRIAPS